MNLDRIEHAREANREGERVNVVLSEEEISLKGRISRTRFENSFNFTTNSFKPREIVCKYKSFKSFPDFKLMNTAKS